MGTVIHCWLERTLVQPLWKKSLPLSTKVQNVHTIGQGNSSSRYTPERNAKHALLAIAKMSIYSRMDKV